MTDTFNGAAEELRQGATELQHGADSARAHGQAAFDEALAAAAAAINDAANRAEKLIKEAVELLKTQTESYAGTAGEKIDKAQRQIVEHVHEKPLTATFTGLGIGVLLGLMLASRR